MASIAFAATGMKNQPLVNLKAISNQTPYVSSLCFIYICFKWFFFSPFLFGYRFACIFFSPINLNCLVACHTQFSLNGFSSAAVIFSFCIASSFFIVGLYFLRLYILLARVFFSCMVVWQYWVSLAVHTLASFRFLARSCESPPDLGLFFFLFSSYYQ